MKRGLAITSHLLACYALLALTVVSATGVPQADYAWEFTNSSDPSLVSSGTVGGWFSAFSGRTGALCLQKKKVL